MDVDGKKERIVGGCTALPFIWNLLANGKQKCGHSTHTGGMKSSLRPPLDNYPVFREIRGKSEGIETKSGGQRSGLQGKPGVHPGALNRASAVVRRGLFWWVSRDIGWHLINLPTARQKGRHLILQLAAYTCASSDTEVINNLCGFAGCCRAVITIYDISIFILLFFQRIFNLIIDGVFVSHKSPETLL
jgi:hypothetical protein